ncbi:MAG: phytoene desaturase [Burkholderiales bacterium]|nr:phytoene desaturase [Bacteroidia bacterium]
MIKTVNIIGSGIGGLATAIRLAVKGYSVTIFEKNSYPGGKLSELVLGKYRFDKGPSLLTLPQLIDELTHLSGSKNKFKYQQLNTITHYFFEDGTQLKAKKDIHEFAKEINLKLNEPESTVIKHIEKSSFYYNIIADIFLKQSISKPKNFLNKRTLKGILNIPKLALFSTMHQQNSSAFKNPKTVQLFNRYATYNGSNPYKAPALLNVIPHLELNLGAYLPENGMHQITTHLVDLAKELGVQIKYNETVEEITIEKNRATGLISNTNKYESDLTISDVDINFLYKKLLPQKYTPIKTLAQEKSSSAYVFYWGIKKEFNELGVHNVLFSNNYAEEFSCLFETDEPYFDPTIYINITSKKCRNDAPIGSENWFVMVNVPHNKFQKEIKYADELRKNVISKINRILNTHIEQYIEEEAILDPFGIELQTASFGGSLYGNSSNNKFSAFLRHANFSNKIKGLYLVGGSVHPGGGIPLCLLSAKIVSDIIPNNNN